jgi:succinate dehydrogenase hydrophobic anchor subunit
MWVFTRVSGLALVLFAAISMGIAFTMGARSLLDMPALMRWTFFPNPNHVVNSDVPDVSLGWSNAFWQVFSILMILLAGTHGVNGLRMVLEDYLTNVYLIGFLRATFVILLVGALIVSVYVILAS